MWQGESVGFSEDLNHGFFLKSWTGKWTVDVSHYGFFLKSCTGKWTVDGFF